MTLALQLFKNSNDTREKLTLNFHSLSVSELLEYGRLSACLHGDKYNLFLVEGNTTHESLRACSMKLSMSRQYSGECDKYKLLLNLQVKFIIFLFESKHFKSGFYL
jgi:hypothetical protein